MARKIVLKEDGLTGTSNTPSGYRYVGYDGTTISEKTGATVSAIGGGDTSVYTEVTINNTQIASMGTSPITLLAAPSAGTYYKDINIIIEATGALGVDFVTQNGGNSLYLIDWGGSIVGFVNRYAFDPQDPGGTVTFVPTLGSYVSASSYWGGDVVATDQTYNLTSGIAITTDNGLNPSAVTAGCSALFKIRYKIGTLGSEL